jgi:hypothetical protein
MVEFITERYYSEFNISQRRDQAHTFHKREVRHEQHKILRVLFLLRCGVGIGNLPCLDDAPRLVSTRLRDAGPLRKRARIDQPASWYSPPFLIAA